MGERVGLILLIGGVVWTIVSILWSRRKKAPIPPPVPGVPQYIPSEQDEPVEPPTLQRNQSLIGTSWPETESAEFVSESPEPESAPCPSCGRLVPIEFKFCDGCGTTLRE